PLSQACDGYAHFLPGLVQSMLELDQSLREPRLSLAACDLQIRYGPAPPVGPNSDKPWAAICSNPRHCSRPAWRIQRVKLAQTSSRIFAIPFIWETNLPALRFQDGWMPG